MGFNDQTPDLFPSTSCESLLSYYPLEKQPQTLNTDKHSSYGHAIAKLKREGRLRHDVQQRKRRHSRLSELRSKSKRLNLYSVLTI